MSSKAGIGIAITTYNRREQLLQLVTSLREHTNPRVPLVVFDDGGCDGSREAVAPLVSAYIQAENRALFYFCRIQPVKRVLLLEDDLLVTQPGWLKLWKRAIDHHGHINLASPSGRSKVANFAAAVAPPETRSAGVASAAAPWGPVRN